MTAPWTIPPPPLPFHASADVRAVLSQMGRTEDVAFSPDGRRLAIADFLAHRIWLLALRVDTCADTPAVSVCHGTALDSPSLRHPHGVCFLGDDHLAVANRSGDVAVFDVSRAGREPGAYAVSPTARISARRYWRTRVRTPGSVAAWPEGGSHRLLVCNDYWHTVSAHRVEIGNAVRIRHDGVRIERALRIPDGIAVSPDRRWVAVSNHVEGQVALYENDAALGRKTPPAAVFPGMVCPHGLCFASEGRRILVADSASPYLHVLECGEGRWDDAGAVMRSVRMCDDDAFYAGRNDAREGGIKGIDLDPTGRVVVTTRRHDVLGLYALDEILDRAGAADPGEIVALSAERNHSLERKRAESLAQRWNLRSLARASLRHMRQRARRERWTRHAQLELRHARLRNRWSRASLLDPAGPVVSLTTRGTRLATAFAAIESIARGDAKPSRLVLWLSEPPAHGVSAPLERLVARGLEIRRAEHVGPHTKYFPYVASEPSFERPLVTADDDVLYPKEWLGELVAAHERNPTAIHCFRARRIDFLHGRLLPYSEWVRSRGTVPSPLNFITGVSGAIYPPKFLEHLKACGRGFEICCPMQDDLWLTVQALRAGYPIAQVRDTATTFLSIPGSQSNTRLFRFNVLEGNHLWQFRKTLSDADVAQLRAFADSPRSVDGPRDATDVR